MATMEGDFAVLFSNAAEGSFNKAFYYLTGIKEPGAALVLVPGGEIQEVFFTPGGTMALAFEAGERSVRVHDTDELGRQLPAYTRGRNTAHISFGDLDQVQSLGRTMSAISTLENVDNTIAAMRILKDSQEIDFLREACEITAQGLNHTFRSLEAGMQEADLADLLEGYFESQGSPGSSFLQAASGPNGTSVHFGAGERVLEDGDLIVFDVGAWWNNYTADISRTVPVSGRFTREQRDIYTVVLNSQKAAIERMVPGATMDAVRQRAQDVLIDGLYDLGLVLDKGNEAQRRFFIAHGYYHFIGLDIHDVWSEFSRMAGEKVYEPGMIMTMEPGLYFPEDRLSSALARLGSAPEDLEMRRFLETIRPVYERYVHIGVRIEDDVLITADGNEVLTAAVPKEIDEVERMMRR